MKIASGSRIIVPLLLMSLAAWSSTLGQGAGQGRPRREATIRPDAFRIILPAWLEERGSGGERIYIEAERRIETSFIRIGRAEVAGDGASAMQIELIDQSRRYFAEAESRRNIGTVRDLRGSIDLYQQSIAGWRGVKSGLYDREQAQSYYQLAATLSDLGNRVEAIESFEQSRLLWRTAGDRQREATTLAQIGRLQQSLGQTAQARRSFDQARLILQLSGMTKFSDTRLDRLSSQAATLFNLGKLSEELGQPPEALRFYQQSLERWREADDKSGQATAHNALGSLAVRNRQILRAKEHFEQALPLWKESGDQRGLAITWSNLGYVLEAGGAIQAAITAYQSSIPCWQKVEDRRGEANSRHDLGRLETLLGNTDVAIESIREAARLRREVGEERGLSLSLGHLGFLYQVRGNFEAARDTYNEALSIVRRSSNGNDGKDSNRLAGLLAGLGESYVGLRDWKNARTMLEESMAIPPATGTTVSRRPLLTLLVRVYSALGDKQRARECYRSLIPSWPVSINTPPES